MRKAGKQDRAIKAITGHQTMAMRMRYDSVDEDDLKRVVTDKPLGKDCTKITPGETDRPESVP